MMHWYSKYGPVILKIVEISSGDLWSQNSFYSIQTSSAFFTVIFSWVYSFPETKLDRILQQIECRSWYEMQLYSIKPDTKEM